jgi:hypothetical protein
MSRTLSPVTSGGSTVATLQRGRDPVVPMLSTDKPRQRRKA